LRFNLLVRNLPRRVIVRFDWMMVVTYVLPGLADDLGVSQSDRTAAYPKLA
jgi:hypothetical protein